MVAKQEVIMIKVIMSGYAELRDLVVSDLSRIRKACTRCVGDKDGDEDEISAHRACCCCRL